MTEYAIETKQVTKQFGRITALDKVDLHLTRGAIYGLVGKSGAGKSTLLRVVSGLQQPSGGTYELFGKDRSDRKIGAERRRIGVVPDGCYLIPRQSLAGNLKRQCRLLGVPGKDRADEVLRLTELTGFAKVRAEKLPEEALIPAAIAMALCGSPDVLLLDDLFAGMSLAQKEKTEEFLKKLNQDLGITILATAEEPQTLAEVATGYGILDHGELRRELSAEEMKSLRETAIRIRVTDVNVLARVLVEKSLRYRVLGSDTADIFGKPHITDLVTALAKEGCEVLTLEERTMQTENFLEALEGGNK